MAPFIFSWDLFPHLGLNLVSSLQSEGFFFFLKLESGDVTIVKKRLVVASFLQLIIIPPHASHTPTLHANCSAAITHVAIKNLKYG